jgi:hypothetical protein
VEENTSSQCYFFEEIGSGTHTVTQYSGEEGNSFSFRSCTKHASLFERRTVG